MGERRGGCVEAQWIETLAMVGATTIVAAMATDMWSSARDRTVELFRHHSPDRQADIATPDHEDPVARSGEAERAREGLVGPWQLELEDFLTRHPDADKDLSALAAEIRAALPAAQQQWVQHNTARDHGINNAVQHGTQHNHYHYMDDRSPRTPAGLATDESQGRSEEHTSEL